MNITEFRYFFEHQLMPNQFFHNTIPFLFELIGDGEEDHRNIGEHVFRMFLRDAKKANVSVLYSNEDVQAELWDLDNGDYMLRIDMLEPQESLQCKTIFLLFNTDFSHLRYFTVELMETKWKHKRYVLCEWTQDGHSNYGLVPNDFGKIETLIVEKFRQGKMVNLSVKEGD